MYYNEDINFFLTQNNKSSRKKKTQFVHKLPLSIIVIQKELKELNIPKSLNRCIAPYTELGFIFVPFSLIN